jgi:hypothetical protein
MIVIGFLSIDTFSHYHLITAEKRVKMQNEASFVLEHMAKYMTPAIGNSSYYPVDFGTDSVRTFVDTNQNGIFDPPAGSYGADRWIGYRRSAANVIEFCANLSYPSGATCASNWEPLSTHLVSNMNNAYIAVDTSLNYLTVFVSACYDPNTISTCGYSENPTVNMTTRIKMPSVAIR